MCLGQRGFPSPAAPLQASSHTSHEVKGESLSTGRAGLSDGYGPLTPATWPCLASALRGLLVRSFASRDGVQRTIRTAARKRT